MSETCLIRFANIEPDIADRYAAWYRDQHVAEVAKVPGITSIAGFRVLAQPAFPAPAWGFAMIMHVSRPPLEVIGDIGTRIVSGDIAPSPVPVDAGPSLLVSAQPLRPHRMASGATAVDKPELLLALTNCTAADHHDIFNEWYDHQHLPDVLSVPGFLRARRYRCAPDTAGQPSPWSYLAVYEIAPGQSATAVAELSRRAGTSTMPLSLTLDMTNIHAQVYVPLA